MSRKKKDLKKETPNFIDSHLVPDENLPDHLNKVIGDHKKLFENYSAYSREHDKIFAKYVLMIEALKQEHDMLKMFLKCNDSDPIEAKRTKSIKDRLSKVLEEEGCVITEISLVLQQLNRDQLLIGKQSKELIEKKEGLRICLNEEVETKNRERYLLDLEHKKHNCTVNLNVSIVENQELRTVIDDIKGTRVRYEATFKALIKEIQDSKECKRILLEEAQQLIEDKETTISFIKGILSSNAKESALYQQKIESMKQMIRYDTKATDFLVRKLNERSDLKSIEQTHRTDELQGILETEMKFLDQLMEEQNAIQDFTEEKDAGMVTHVYNTKEADKMALFNYIADLNGELINLKQRHTALIQEIENLNLEDQNITEDFENSMAKNELVYGSLSEELEGYDAKSTEVHATMQVIKEFIECTFKTLSCSMQTMEDNLGLNIEVNPRNMPAYLRELENQVSSMVQSLQYANYLKEFIKNSSIVDEEEMSAVAEKMMGYEEQGRRKDDSDFRHSTTIHANFLPNPSRDYPEYSSKASNGADAALSSKEWFEKVAEANIKEKLETSAKPSGKVKIATQKNDDF